MTESLAYIDDNNHNLDCIGLIMEREYKVNTFSDPRVFLGDYSSTSYASIILDIHMPLMDGFALYEKIVDHPHYNGCPVFFISSDDTDENRIKAFTLGAVDFLNRHMTSAEMLTRVKSKIIFFQKHREMFFLGNLKLNNTLLKALVNNKEVKLTFIEFKMLNYFLKHPGHIIQKEELNQHVWGGGTLDATIYTHISNLNSKLGDWDYIIVSPRNQGMQLVPKTRK